MDLYVRFRKSIEQRVKSMPHNRRRDIRYPGSACFLPPPPSAHRQEITVIVGVLQMSTSLVPSAMLEGSADHDRFADASTIAQAALEQIKDRTSAGNRSARSH